MRTILAIAALALAGGCVTKPDTPAPSPAALAYAAKNSYEAALIVAVRYNELPRCGSPSATLACSDPSAVATLRKANDAARIALDAAETTVRQPGITEDAKQAAVVAAVSAVDALKAILTVYSKGK